MGVKRGDHIVAVNGVRGTASGILQRMRHAKELEIELHRPATYTVQITKNPGGLGIETRQAQHSRSLMVSHLVGTGAVKDWNDSGQDKKVRLHDRIVKVNGCAGTVEELTEKIMAVQDGMEFCLTFTAAPPSAQSARHQCMREPCRATSRPENSIPWFRQLARPRLVAFQPAMATRSITPFQRSRQ